MIFEKCLGCFRVNIFMVLLELSQGFLKWFAQHHSIYSFKNIAQSRFHTKFYVYN